MLVLIISKYQNYVRRVFLGFDLLVAKSIIIFLAFDCFWAAMFSVINLWTFSTFFIPFWYSYLAKFCSSVKAFIKVKCSSKLLYFFFEVFFIVSKNWCYINWYYWIDFSYINIIYILERMLGWSLQSLNLKSQIEYYKNNGRTIYEMKILPF